MKTFANPIFACCLALLSSTFSEAAESKSSDEQTIRDLDTQWSKAAAAKDVDKTVSYYSDDTVVLPANAPIATTKEAVRKIWQDLLTSPGAAVSWTTTKVNVARSGEMAYCTGTYEITTNDASGKPVTDRGKYLEVWKKRGATWKCVADIWNSDLPASSSATTPTSSEAK